MMSAANEALLFDTTVRHAPLTLMLAPRLNFCNMPFLARTTIFDRAARSTIPVSVMIPVNIKLKNPVPTGLTRTPKKMLVSFFHPDCTVGFGISPNRVREDSRAIPPIGTFTQPRRSADSIANGFGCEREKCIRGSPPRFASVVAEYSARGQEGGPSAFAFAPRPISLSWLCFLHARRQEIGSEMRGTNDAQPRKARMTHAPLQAGA